MNIYVNSPDGLHITINSSEGPQKYTFQAIPVPDKSSDGDLPEISREDVHWSSLLTEMNSYDQRMIDDWKDELGNLLIFAGLFSAVVTAFTVVSYTLFQPDSGDSTVQLLQLISLQLSSFTLNSTEIGLNLLNSTVKSTVSPNSTDVSSAPTSSLLVKVNNLWFLSLTLSLVASFFAITVQQWLRRGPLPQGLSSRDAVRLRQLRYDGLHLWQVPTIIAILPVVLQVALILFLVGLTYFLDTLNHGIAHTVVITLVISLSLYTLATVTPAVKATCPYKSAIIPIIYAVHAGIMKVVYLLLLLAYELLVSPLVIVACLLVAICLLVIVCISQDPEILTFLHSLAGDLFRAVLNNPGLTLAARMKGAQSVVDKEVFWSRREINQLPRSGPILEESALMWSTRALPFHAIQRIAAQCSQDLEQPRKARLALMLVVSHATGKALQDSLPIENLLDSDVFMGVHTETLTSYKRFLFQSLPPKEQWHAMHPCVDDICVVYSLLLLCDMEKRSTDDASKRTYVQMLLTRKNSTIYLEHGIAKALYHLLVRDQVKFAPDDEGMTVIRELLTRATSSLKSARAALSRTRMGPMRMCGQIYTRLPVRAVRQMEAPQYLFSFRTLRTCLYSTSTALYILRDHNDETLLEEVRCILEGVDTVTKICQSLPLQESLECGLLQLVQEITRLTEAHILPMHEPCPSRLLVDELWKQCDAPPTPLSDELQEIFRKLVEVLTRYREIVSGIPIGTSALERPAVSSVGTDVALAQDVSSTGTDTGTTAPQLTEAGNDAAVIVLGRASTWEADHIHAQILEFGEPVFTGHEYLRNGMVGEFLEANGEGVRVTFRTQNLAEDFVHVWNETVPERYPGLTAALASS